MPIMRIALVRQEGFTLVELAVVLVVLALLIAGVLGPLRTQVESRERQRTTDELNAIMEALYGYTVIYGRLPCPDTNGDGIPNPDPAVPSGVCDAVEGSVPWVVLGTPPADPWNTLYRYRVSSTDFTKPDDGICAPYDSNNDGDTSDPGDIPDDNDLDLCQQGNITVRDAPTGTPGSVNVATDVAAVVLSYGSNKNDAGLAVNGDLSTHEQENSESPGDNEFVFRTFSRDDAQEFDDLVVWISPNILKNRMVMAGRLP